MFNNVIDRSKVYEQTFPFSNINLIKRQNSFSSRYQQLYLENFSKDIHC